MALKVKKPGSSELADAQIALREAWKKNNHFLEYDVQAEFSFLVSLLYGGSGLSFRMSKDGKEYLALSFMKFYTPSLMYQRPRNRGAGGGWIGRERVFGRLRGGGFFARYRHRRD